VNTAISFDRVVGCPGWHGLAWAASHVSTPTDRGRKQNARRWRAHASMAKPERTRIDRNSPGGACMPIAGLTTHA